MRARALLSIVSVVFLAAPAWALKRTPYPEVPVVALPAFPGDPSLDHLRKHLADAAAGGDVTAIAAMVAPNFAWTVGDSDADELDTGRNAEHNFKVAFGFRPHGRDTDGPTEIGPQWELLQFFAEDPILTREKESGLVCGTATAKIADPGTLDQAFMLIDETDDLSEWVYFTGELELSAQPGGGDLVAKVGNLALPIFGAHPEIKDGAPVMPTHLELLLPSGKSGWAAMDRVRPLFVDRLCFAKADGEWKIAAYEQAE